MTTGLSARFALRAATSAEHDEVDTAFSGFDLGRTDHYRAFLRAQAEAFIPVEDALCGVDLHHILPDWEARRRSDALAADLHDLGDDSLPAFLPFTVGSTAAALGAVYVLEGSRLGGRMLVRSVGEGLPRRFLGNGDPSLWRGLTAVLDQDLIFDAQMSQAIEAARDVFARFAASATRHGKV